MSGNSIGPMIAFVQPRTVAPPGDEANLPATIVRIVRAAAAGGVCFPEN